MIKDTSPKAKRIIHIGPRVKKVDPKVIAEALGAEHVGSVKVSGGHPGALAAAGFYKQRMAKLMKRKSMCGNGGCSVSTGIHGGLTFGFGNLDHNGFWDVDCEPCTERNNLREENIHLKTALHIQAQSSHEKAQQGHHCYYPKFETCTELSCQNNNAALGNKRIYLCYFNRCLRSVESMKGLCHEHKNG